jgi:molybdenum cofactor guanylyltransferase
MLTIAIQSGGQSSRMGQDKALLPFLGKPLIQRVVARLKPLSADILITTNQPKDYQFLKFPLVPDLMPGTGALGGLYTALTAARNSFVAVVACDMPFANPDLLSECLAIILESDFDAVIPRTDFGLEPIHAVYRRETCIPAIETALQSQQRRVIAWHANANIRILLPAEYEHLDPHKLTFWNVNTPKEFQQAEQKAIELEVN